MSQSYKTGDFNKYFTENMKALGLSVPSGLFDTSEKATATAILILGTVKELGKGATMAEIAGATIVLEKLAVLASISAAGYVGAVIGSITVATGRSLSCGYRISDMFVFLDQNKLIFNNWTTFDTHNPQIMDKNHPFRSSFGLRCKNPAVSFVYA